jgi:hypothetical protein
MKVTIEITKQHLMNQAPQNMEAFITKKLEEAGMPKGTKTGKITVTTRDNVNSYMWSDE